LKTRVVQRMSQTLARHFPEQRLFIKSASGTRFIHLRPPLLVALFAGVSLFVAWTAIVTAIFLLDTLSAGDARQQARHERQTYEARLQTLTAERDRRTVLTEQARARFHVALGKISQMQSLLLHAEERQRELATGVEALQKTLRTTMHERDRARRRAGTLLTRLQDASGHVDTQTGRVEALNGTVDFLARALDNTASERDMATSAASAAGTRSKALQVRLRLTLERNARIFGRLERAVNTAIKPLDKLFRKIGLPTDRILQVVRKGYTGQGGPLLPIAFTANGAPSDPQIQRANALLAGIGKINRYRIAAEETPLAMPVKSLYRLSSPFGMRNDPKGRGRRMHTGIDMAARRGTPIYATGDGVVEFAGRESGYGNIIKIRHAFGYETFYAHLSRIRVKRGQRVSRGERIGDMGSTGRSTGPHLHYEVRAGGKPVNPQTYIKAGQNVF